MQRYATCGAVRFAIVAIVILPALATPSHARTLSGQASVIDGDTIEIRRQRIRLSGIDAPESDQLCRGDDSLQYVAARRLRTS